MSEATSHVDVLVVGAGTAGSGAALMLARARRTVLVVDADRQRNRVTNHVNGFLSRDGITPQQLRAVTRRELTTYGATLLTDTVEDLTAGDGDLGGFTATIGTGRIIGSRRLVLATGAADALPSLPGISELWGGDVVSCPYCHGWEFQDQPLLILGEGEHGARLAITLTQWSDDVMLASTTDDHGLDNRLRLALEAARVTVLDLPARELQHERRRLRTVRLADGSTVRRSACFVATGATPRLGLFEKIGGVVGDPPLARVDPTGRSEVAGCWIVGNAADPTQHSMMAAAHGSRAGQAINQNLLDQDVTDALSPGTTSAGANR